MNKFGVWLFASNRLYALGQISIIIIIVLILLTIIIIGPS
jgi:hypothetical protein